MDFKVFDKYRGKNATQILSIHFDRQGKPNLVVYLDEKQPHGAISETDKYYCNEFDLEVIQ